MKQYLQFKPESGVPASVGPTQEGTCIEIDDTLSNEIKNGTKSLNQFLVVYDDKLKKYVINEIGFGNLEESVNETPASHTIYQIPVVEKVQDGINLVQDIKRRKWKLVVQGDILDALKTISNKNLYQMFYVTGKDNPNLLHNELKIDLLKEQYEIEDVESVNLNISVFCKKIYNDYYHVREND